VTDWAPDVDGELYQYNDQSGTVFIRTPGIYLIYSQVIELPAVLPYDILRYSCTSTTMTLRFTSFTIGLNIIYYNRIVCE